MTGNWHDLVPKLLELAKSEGLTLKPAVIEEVAKVMAGFRPMDDSDFNRAGIILLHLVNRASQGEPKATFAVGSAIRMIIRGMTMRAIVEILGLDESLVVGLMKKVYDFIKG